MRLSQKAFDRMLKAILPALFVKIPLILRNPKNPENVLEEPNDTFLMSASRDDDISGPSYLYLNDTTILDMNTF